MIPESNLWQNVSKTDLLQEILLKNIVQVLED